MSAAARFRLVLVVGALLVPPGVARAQGPQAVGQVTAVVGTARVERFQGAEVVPLAVAAEVFEGDRVVTARRSKVRLELVDGSVLRLGEETELELTWVLNAPEQETRNVMIAVGLGIVRSVVETVVPQSWFELRTATAITAVRGTDWILEAQPAATPVVALEGEVEVRNVDERIDEVVVLGPGDGTTVAAGEPPSEVAEWGQARVDSFIERTAVDVP